MGENTGILSKIKAFFRNIFNKPKMIEDTSSKTSEELKAKQLAKATDTVSTSSKENSFTKSIKVNLEHDNEEISKDASEEDARKKELYDMYEKLKNGEIDIFSLEPQMANKLCELLEEENRLQEKSIKNIENEINEIDEKLRKLEETA